MSVLHNRTARLWTDWLDDKLRPGCIINPADVAMMTMLGNVARMKEAPITDTEVDEFLADSVQIYMETRHEL